MIHTPHSLARLVAALLLAALLAACGVAQIPPPADATPVPPTSVATLTPTTAPTEAPLPTTAPTIEPTAPPAPSATPPPVTNAPLVGPEWTVIAGGNLYGDGGETVIAYKPSTLAVHNLPPEYAGFNLVAEQAVIVQRGPDGQPRVRALVLTNGVLLNGSTSAIFPAGGPNDATRALALSLEQPGAPLRLVPVDATGQVAATGIALTWNATTRAFDLQQLYPPHNAFPGPGWQMIGEDDFNDDGLLERIFARPATITPDSSFGAPHYSRYTFVAAEVMIAQVGQQNIYPLVTIDTREVRTPSRVLTPLVYPDSQAFNTPAAFLVAVDRGSYTPLSVIPINSAGQGYTQGFALAWSQAEGSYVVVTGPAAIGEPGLISGRLGYPSQGVPALDIYAVKVGDPGFFYHLRTNIHSVSYELRVKPGRYLVFAYPVDLPGSDFGGAFTEYVRCGLIPVCTDHRLLPVNVASGATVTGIDITDWYTPPGTIPPRPAGTPQS